MKQFNLDEYLANPLRKVVTGDGRIVRRILCTDAKGYYPIVALVERYSGTIDDVAAYTKDGKYLTNVETCHDLFFAEEKHEGWINVFDGCDDSKYIGDSRVFNTKEDAEKAGKDQSNYIASVKIEWEE